MRSLICEAENVASKVRIDFPNWAASNAIRELARLLGTDVVCLIAIDEEKEMSHRWKNQRVAVAETLRPARRPHHPGVLADKERLARSWTYDDMAAALHWPTERVRDFIETAIPLQDSDCEALAQAFSTSAKYWRNLYDNWRTWSILDAR